MRQIDVLPENGRGGTPLADPVELTERSRTPDTADGLYFTDLFSVSHTRRPHAFQVTGSQQQQQQQTQPPPPPRAAHSSPDLFVTTR